MPIKDSVTKEDVVVFLSEIIRLDPAFAKQLLNGDYIPCNERILNHETIQCDESGARLIGVLNGLFGKDDDTGCGAFCLIVDKENLSDLQDIALMTCDRTDKD